MTFTDERIQELAGLFWESDEGAGARQGARLDNPAILPHFLSAHVDLANDDEIEAFYGFDSREEGSPYYAIKSAVIASWPEEQAVK